jgi:aminopeptidase N
MEKTFPKTQEQVQVPNITPLGPKGATTVTVTKPLPSPARNAQAVADDAVRAMRFYADRFGPYPYSSMAITQMPGLMSQGWPGLIFLSSYVFLTPEERARMHLDPVDVILDQQVTAHETAHQWWGDLVYWRTYRDQWISEGLSNYSSMMMLEMDNPVGFRAAMERYRENLLSKNNSSAELKDAGPVTLGIRLSSSEFPQGYEAISYGRGTWLFHMLRHIMDDGVKGSDNSGDARTPFIRALRTVRERYSGKPMTTRQLLDVFAEQLPGSVRYEGKKSLDWFYDGWINGTAVPRFELQAVKLTAKGSAMVAAGTIVQKDAPK